MSANYRIITPPPFSTGKCKMEDEVWGFGDLKGMTKGGGD